MKNKYAFPFHTAYESSEGMSLRDYFAAFAMQAQIACLLNGDANTSRGAQRAMEKAGVSDPKELIAKNSYEFADAMLEQRLSGD